MLSGLHTDVQAYEMPAYRIGIDEGIIVVEVLRFWCVEDTRRYWGDIAWLLPASRERRGGGRVLIDRRGAPIQSAEVVSELQRGFREIYRPQDRIAVVVASSLQKIQSRRLYDERQTKTFLSYDAANLWIGNV